MKCLIARLCPVAPAAAATLTAVFVFLSITLTGCEQSSYLATQDMHLDFGKGYGRSEISGIGVDNAGNIYVAERRRHIIHKVTPKGQVTVLAGTVGARGYADGVGSQARFHSPIHIAADSVGNVYVSGNHAIRKITPQGSVATLAGLAGDWRSAEDSYVAADGVGTAARFVNPRDLAVDRVGNVYVSDGDSIRKVTQSGVVSTLVVTQNDSGDSDAKKLGGSIAVDNTGNIYTANNYFIRKLTHDGRLTTLAGKEGVSGSSDGTGADVRFGPICCMAADNAGNIYIADKHTVRKMSPAGLVSTIGSAPPTILGMIFGRSSETGSYQGIAVFNNAVYLNTSRDIEIIRH